MNRIKDISLIAILTSLLVVQEELLSFLPNIQLTVFLIVLYSKILGFKKTSLIVTIYVLLDSMIMGAMNPIFMIFLYIGWMVMVVLTVTVFKKIDNNILLALIGFLYALIYSWIMVIPSIFIYKVSFIAYIIEDILFEILLASSSFLSILLLYEPLSSVFRKALTRYYNKKEEVYK